MIIQLIRRYRNAKGNSVIHWACRRNRVELVEYLVNEELGRMDARGNPYPSLYLPVLNRPDILHGETPIFQSRSAESIQFLLEKAGNRIKLDLERTTDGLPLLHYCAEASTKYDSTDDR